MLVNAVGNLNIRDLIVKCSFSISPKWLWRWLAFGTHFPSFNNNRPAKTTWLDLSNIHFKHYLRQVIQFK